MQQLAQRFVLLLLGDLVAQDAPLAVALDAVGCRQVGAQLGANPLAGHFGEFVIQSAELFDAKFVLSGDKSLENLVFVHGFGQPPAGVVHFECGGHLRWGHVTHLDRAHQCRESCIACIDLNVAPGAPCVQAVVICL